MSGQDGLRNEIAIAVWTVLQREMPSEANTKRADLAADAVLQARIDAAREQVAELPANAVELLAEMRTMDAAILDAIRVGIELGQSPKEIHARVLAAIHASYTYLADHNYKLSSQAVADESRAERLTAERDAAEARAEAAEQAVQRVHLAIAENRISFSPGAVIEIRHIEAALDGTP